MPEKLAAQLTQTVLTRMMAPASAGLSPALGSNGSAAGRMPSLAEMKKAMARLPLCVLLAMRLNAGAEALAPGAAMAAPATIAAPAATQLPTAAPAKAITAPLQPTSGPGGSQYAHASVVEHTYGEGDLQYWLFEPADPKPKSAPVVIFNHGWGAMKPGGYRAWINHIVRRGNIVIYPRYQASLRTSAKIFSTNAIDAAKDALQRLQKEDGHVRPQLDKLAIVGHSAGGQISAGIAARAVSAGLPAIKAVMCVQPGKTWGPFMGRVPLDDVKPMPAATLLLTVAGDRDTVVKDIDAKRIINESVLVLSQNKNYVKIVSDEHGNPPLVANHFCPAAPAPDSSDAQGAQSSPGKERVGPIRQLLRERMRQRLQQGGSAMALGAGAPAGATQKQDDSFGNQAQADEPELENKNMRGINALDYYCTWKLFDALEDAAFYGKNRDYALGNTPQQRYMGKWSDGVPVKELVVQVGEAK